MNRFSLATVITIVALTSLAGCTRPIYNVTEDAAPTAVHSVDKVGAIIKKAARDEKWTINQSSPGEIVATIHWRIYSATSKIHYTASKYSIELVSSVNLKQKDGSIHYKYNEYVQKLQKLIDQRLADSGVE